MIEFDVDMGYLLEEGELDSVVLNDENGEHEPMTFYPGGGDDKSRWAELFGTPERAAKTLSIMQRCELGIIGNCEECEMHDACKVRDGDYDALLEWLRGDV